MRRYWRRWLEGRWMSPSIRKGRRCLRIRSKHSRRPCAICAVLDKRSCFPFGCECHVQNAFAHADMDAMHSALSESDNEQQDSCIDRRGVGDFCGLREAAKAVENVRCLRQMATSRYVRQENSEPSEYLKKSDRTKALVRESENPRHWPAAIPLRLPDRPRWSGFRTISADVRPAGAAHA